MKGSRREKKEEEIDGSDNRAGNPGSAALW